MNHDHLYSSLKRAGDEKRRTVAHLIKSALQDNIPVALVVSTEADVQLAWDYFKELGFEKKASGDLIAVVAAQFPEKIPPNSFVVDFCQNCL